MQFIKKLENFYNVLDEENRLLRNLSYEELYEKIKDDNFTATEKAKKLKMPVYTPHGNKKNTDKRNKSILARSIVHTAECSKGSNLAYGGDPRYKDDYMKYRKIHNNAKNGEHRIFVEAATFLMIEKCKLSGDTDSFEWMIENCIFTNLENILEEVAKGAFKIIHN